MAKSKRVNVREILKKSQEEDVKRQAHGIRSTTSIKRLGELERGKILADRRDAARRAQAYKPVIGVLPLKK